jgi:hypothetical protein
VIRLFYNYYEDKHPTRKKEIDFCLQKNLDNPYIKTIIVEHANKPTYDYFFQKINDITEDNDINIICNSDIFFDETIKLTENIKHRELYSLLRWEYHPGAAPQFYERPDSQDTWIVRGKIENVFGGFTLGIRGCDNRIAYEFLKSGYIVNNPSKSIRSYHFHTSQIRNYTMAECIPPPYHTLMPTNLSMTND